MKKISISFIAAFGLMLAAPTTASAQAVEQGNVIIDTYYGFPNLYTTVFKSTYANSGTETNLEIGGLGPVGLRAEYMVADKIGVGLDIGFNNSHVNYSEETTVYNSTTGNYDPVTYDYNFSTQKIGVMATLNYHFLDNDKVDAYGVFGAGYGQRSYKFESTDPDYVNEEIKGLIPVAMRIGVGMRYFFTDNIGLNLGLGFGQGGIANAGISFKF